jgi:hypothetical protein
MSAWGDTLTEQLAHDILMDQQHLVGPPLTPLTPALHHRGGVVLDANPQAEEPAVKHARV